MTESLSQKLSLNDKTALITGASSGLGTHFAQVLATHGAQVVLAARREKKLADQVAQLRDQGYQAHAVPLDVNEPRSVQAAMQYIQQELGGFHILINNAGVASEPKKFVDTDEDDWQFVMQTNLTGAWRVARETARCWQAQEQAGSIINISSIYGLKTGALKVAYNVSKAGVVQLTKSMAVELVRKNIRVNALCPGWFQTALNEDYFNSESGQRYVKTIPMRRLGDMHDLDGPLMLLASDAGAYMTGTTVCVDGGISESPI